MADQVMTTLNLIKGGVHSLTWMRILEANGGIKADYNKLFPLSSVLESSSLEETLECFRALPEHKRILEKFTLYCVKEASTPTDGEVVHNAIAVLEKHVLKGGVASKELSDAYKGIHDLLFSKPHVSDNRIARAIMGTIEVVRAKNILPRSSTAVHDPATHDAYEAAYWSARHSSKVSSGGEVPKQKEHLRMLLDGEKYCSPEVRESQEKAKPQKAPRLWSFIVKTFKK